MTKPTWTGRADYIVKDNVRRAEMIYNVNDMGSMVKARDEMLQALNGYEDSKKIIYTLIRTVEHLIEQSDMPIDRSEAYQKLLSDVEKEFLNNDQ